MSEVNFGLTMKDAWKMLLYGKDYVLYRQFEGNNTSLDDLKDRVYKINYILFVVLTCIGFLVYKTFVILYFSLLWYKPVCHALHLKNRVKRYNIERFKNYKGLT